MCVGWMFTSGEIGERPLGFDASALVPVSTRLRPPVRSRRGWPTATPPCPVALPSLPPPPATTRASLTSAGQTCTSSSYRSRARRPRMLILPSHRPVRSNRSTFGTRSSLPIRPSVRPLSRPSCASPGLRQIDQPLTAHPRLTHLLLLLSARSQRPASQALGCHSLARRPACTW
jgi:hypothetical protein